MNEFMLSIALGMAPIFMLVGIFAFSLYIREKLFGD